MVTGTQSNPGTIVARKDRLRSGWLAVRTCATRTTLNPLLPVELSEFRVNETVLSATTERELILSYRT